MGTGVGAGVVVSGGLVAGGCVAGGVGGSGASATMARPASRIWVANFMACIGFLSRICSCTAARYGMVASRSVRKRFWQTIGRGIRGGCPVFIGFVDYKFAPLSFDWKDNAPVDNGKTSALVQAIHQLKLAMDPESNPNEHRVARLLYEPFYRALCQTEGRKHGQY